MTEGVKVLRSMTTFERMRAQRCVNQLQVAGELQQVIVRGAWLNPTSIERAGSDELDYAREAWHEFLRDMEVDPTDQSVQIDWSTGDIWRPEIVMENDTNS